MMAGKNGGIMRIVLCVVMIGVLLGFVPVRGAEMNIIAFYDVKPCKTPPAIDGTLDDPAWETAGRAMDYYEYFKVSPGPGALRTEFRMLYDDKGIYLGIINYDSNMDKISAKHVTRDNQDLWQDDCAEIYFDPTGTGIGFLKFVVNSLGVQADMKRVDAAISLANWNGIGWRVAVGKRQGAWVIEAFFPWGDLEKKAAPGDIWRFCHARYAYTSGAFQGMTWSPGGSYTSPDKFGYLYFGKEGKLNLTEVSDLMAKTVTPPWSLLDGEDILVCESSGERKSLRAETMARKEIDSLHEALRRADGEVSRLKAAGGSLPGEELESVRKEIAAIPEKIPDAMAAIVVLRKTAELKHRADAVYWEARVRQLADL
ncbi:MAG: sugar-binding protein [Victivallales bacterium]